MMITVIDGVPVELTAWGKASAGQKSAGNLRVRRMRKREEALRFYFRQIAAGRDAWVHVRLINRKAPALVKRCAEEAGVTDLKMLKV